MLNQISATTLLRLSLVTLLLSMTTACGHTDSKELATEEIFPSFEVRTDANGISRVSAILMSDFFTFVRISKGDQIIVTGGTASTALDGEASFNTGNAADTAFRFDFQRQNKVDAPASTGSLPSPMTLNTPAAASSYSVQDDAVIVSWSQLGSIDTMSVEIAAVCRSFTGVKPLDANYIYDINGDLGFARLSLADTENSLAPNCSVYDANLILRRSREGTLDRAYGPTDTCENSGNCFYPSTGFMLRQVRAVPIVLNNRPAQ